MAKTSLPIPLDVGSSTVRAMAVASAASTALPPFSNIASPALAARGWLVATTPFEASKALRRDA